MNSHNAAVLLTLQWVARQRHRAAASRAADLDRMRMANCRSCSVAISNDLINKTIVQVSILPLHSK